MATYQVQYKINSKTFVEDISADTVTDVLAIFEALSVADITEIRKYVYAPLNPIIPNDDKDYQNLSCKLKRGQNTYISIPLKKTKKDINFTTLQNLIKSTFEINGFRDYEVLGFDTK